MPLLVDVTLDVPDWGDLLGVPVEEGDTVGAPATTRTRLLPYSAIYKLESAPKAMPHG